MCEIVIIEFSDGRMSHVRKLHDRFECLAFGGEPGITQIRLIGASRRTVGGWTRGAFLLCGPAGGPEFATDVVNINPDHGRYFPQKGFDFGSVSDRRRKRYGFTNGIDALVGA